MKWLAGVFFVKLIFAKKDDDGHCFKAKFYDKNHKTFFEL
jgi:hypothetical protein